MNDRFTEGISTLIVGAVYIFIVAVFTGTILYYLWEGSLTAMFPKAVENGVLAEKIEWFACVKIVWVLGILFSALKTTLPSKKENINKKQIL